MAAGRDARRAEISFEVYADREGRWLIEGVFRDRAEALEFARSLCRERDLDGVRVVREVYHPERNEAFERVIFDTGIAIPKAPAPGPPPAGAPQAGGTGSTWQGARRRAAPDRPPTALTPGPRRRSGS